MTVGLLEAGVARQLGHVLRAGGIVAILRGDRRQGDPILQPLDRLIVAFRDLATDVAEVIGIRADGQYGDDDE